MNLDQELDILIRARATLIVLLTQEEERAIEVLSGIAGRKKTPLIVWDFAEGFTRKDQLSFDGQTQPLIRDPLAALEEIENTDGSGIYLLLDFHDCWTFPQVRRKLRNLARRFKGNRKTIIVTSPDGGVPEELKNDAAIVKVPLPDVDDHHKVLQSILKTPGARVALTDAEQLKMAEAAVGLTLAQAQRIFAKVLVSDGIVDAQDIDYVTQDKKDIIRECRALEFYSVKETPESVGGLDRLKEWLKLRNRAWTPAARGYGLPVPKGIALIGIPGTGKSLSAKMIAGVWRLPLLRLDVGALYDSFVGKSEESTRRALQLAETVAPCVMWIDEVEKALAHGGHDSGTSVRVFGTLLTWMQEKKAPCFVVATANDISALPPELLRRGRFDDIFFLDLPNLNERKEIFAVHLRKRNRDPQGFDVEQLARCSQGYVGAEIEQAIIDAMYVGFNQNREFATPDIAAALKQQVPLSVSQRETVEMLRSWLTEGRALSASAPGEA